MKAQPKRPPESVKDFRARIAGIMRGGNCQSGSDPEGMPLVRHVPPLLLRNPKHHTPSEDAWAARLRDEN